MDTNHFKELLLEEKKKLEGELKELGVKNATNPKDWEATAEDPGEQLDALKEMEPDSSDMADRIEEYETRAAEEAPIEERFNNVVSALKKIEEGTYGWCDGEGEKHEIEEGRLKANPAATSCTKHMK